MSRPALITTTLAFVLTLLFSQSAFAQDSVRLSKARPGTVHVHANPENCASYTATAQAVIHSISEVPKSHRWIVACSLEAWNAALKKSGNWGRTNTAFTVESTEITVINGTIFEEEEKFYRRLIAHEAAHAVCRCSSEEEAREEAIDMLRTAKPGSR